MKKIDKLYFHLDALITISKSNDFNFMRSKFNLGEVEEKANDVNYFFVMFTNKKNF